MYDTLKLWLPAQSIVEVNYIDRLPCLLSNQTQHIKAGKIYITGSYKGLLVSVSESGLSLKGSLAKHFLNDNFKTLTRQDTQTAIEMLSDSFSLPINEAYVSRIDVAKNFLVDCKPELYYDYLGDCNYYKRLLQPKSLYYANTLRTKLFYNKIAETKSKGVLIPYKWQGTNILRYELRYISRLPKQFNVSKVLASNLYAESFYLNLVDRWLNEYEAINKLNTINLNYDAMTKPKDVINQFAALFISGIGQNEALKIVEQLKAKNCFQHAEYYSRLKKEIKKLSKTFQSEQANELIIELNKKVKEAKDEIKDSIIVSSN